MNPTEQSRKPSQQRVDPEKIRSMFSEVAAKYDRANTVLSMGIHHQWRKKLVALSKAKPEDRILDCATGTGDLAIEFKKAVGSGGVVIGTDFCQEMLQSAPEKARQKSKSGPSTGTLTCPNSKTITKPPGFVTRAISARAF